jgi:hypothetical protein
MTSVVECVDLLFHIRFLLRAVLTIVT